MSGGGLTVVIVMNFMFLSYCIKIPQLPHNPCPSVLRYLYNGQNWLASITVPSPPKSANEANLFVDFSVEGICANGSFLSINDYDNSMHKIEYRLPLTYTVQFVRHTHIPRITLIKLNDDIFCSGPPALTSSWLTLTHKLFWYTNSPTSTSTSIPIPTYTTSSAFPQHLHNDIENTISHSDYTTPSYNNNIISLTPKFRNSNKCGIISKPIISRISGGEEPLPNSHPWLAALLNLSNKQSKPEFFCAGNLISTKHILTAAHCIQNKNYNQILVGLGIQNMMALQEPEIQFRSISYAIKHPEYTNKAHADIAFIVLNGEVEINSDVRPICLWIFRPSFQGVVGLDGTIMGWGQKEDGQLSQNILETTVTITTKQNCRRNELLRNIVTDHTFCAGQTGAGPCSGDSGGGFFLKIDRKWYLRGIISTAIADIATKICDVNSYSVYVDVAQYKDWITNNMERYP